MNEETVLDLIRKGESETVEFKTSFDREAVETLVAFANTQGGIVLIGVADDGSVRGAALGKETLNDWLIQIKSATSPSIIPDVEALPIAGRTVVVIWVGEYPVKPISTRGHYFKRVATANHQLRLSEITDLYMQSLQLSWDAYEAPRESLDALSLSKIERFIDQVNQSGRFTLDQSPLLALEKLKYIVNERPTWAALLLFADNPLRHHIHIGRFKAPAVIIDDRQITDTLYTYHLFQPGETLRRAHRRRSQDRPLPVASAQQVGRRGFLSDEKHREIRQRVHSHPQGTGSLPGGGFPGRRNRWRIHGDVPLKGEGQ